VSAHPGDEPLPLFDVAAGRPVAQAPPIPPERDAPHQLPDDGQAVYLIPGDPLGLALAAAGNLTAEYLCATVYRPAAHALDFGPTARLDVERVRAVHAALGAWLAEHDR
jgi:hypothetical protein